MTAFNPTATGAHLQQPGTDVEVRVERRADGKLLPGARLNPGGRARGSRNRRTLRTVAILKRSADRVARELLKTALRGTDVQMRTAAQLQIIRLVWPLLEAEHREGADTGWIKYLTDGELDQLASLHDAAVERMPVEPDAFDADSIPPPSVPVAPPALPAPAPADELVVEVPAREVPE